MKKAYRKVADRYHELVEEHTISSHPVATFPEGAETQYWAVATIDVSLYRHVSDLRHSTRLTRISVSGELLV